MLLDTAAALIRLLPPETAHNATVRLLRVGGGLLPATPPDDPVLRSRVLGLDFANPIGLAAGFDKNGVAAAPLFRLGFGFVEAGTVTPRSQAGNPRPRLFRLSEDRAVINRMGFNNRGAAALAQRLARHRPAGILGLNLGANKDSADRIADYRLGFQLLARFASYVAVNVSSPNTPGLRGLQNRDELARLLEMLAEARAQAGLAVPLLLKIAPDVDAQAMDDIADVCLFARIEGLIVSNTTIARPQSLKSRHAAETGGLSGAPLFAPSTGVLKAMRRRLGTGVVLIGVGGIASGRDAYAKIRAGADLVQLYTALVYQGPELVTRIKRDLAALLRADGYASVGDAVGADLR